MAGIDRQRGQDREDVGLEVGVEVLAVGVRHVADALAERQSLGGERGQHVLHEARAMLANLLPHDGRDRRELVLGRHAVGSTLDDPGGHLLLEPRHPHLEELVEVAAEDRQELEPLQQRRARVQRLVEHAAVELEPGELAIEVERGVPEVDRRGRHLRTKEFGHTLNVGDRTEGRNEL